MLEDFCHSLLLKLPPEFSHKIGKFGMRHRIFAHGVYETETSKIKLFDVELPNSFGLAAGFDKYAQLHGVVRDYGFAWVEAGSFTAGGGKGNKGRRLLRLPDGSLANRMGLNCISSYEAAEIYGKVEDQTTFAVNIAKTHDPKKIGDEAIEDLVLSYNLLKNFGIYTAINISCPNTKEGKTFEELGSFTELLSALKGKGKGRPVVFKFSPVLLREKLEELVEISDDFADGYEVVNTRPYEHDEFGKCGLSGPSLRREALGTVKALKQMTDKTILGVGGISAGKDFFNMKEAGANVCLAYTGFVYKHKNNLYAGPKFAHRVLGVYEEILEIKDNLVEAGRNGR